MIIDVNDPSLNVILNTCFYLLLVLGAVSLVPWKLKNGKNRWTLTLPVFAIGIYIMYEFSMPDNWDIRLDLVFLWPVLIIILLSTLIRVILIWRYPVSSRGN